MPAKTKTAILNIFWPGVKTKRQKPSIMMKNKRDFSFLDEELRFSFALALYLSQCVCCSYVCRRFLASFIHFAM